MNMTAGAGQAWVETPAVRFGYVEPVQRPGYPLPPIEAPRQEGDGGIAERRQGRRAGHVNGTAWRADERGPGWTIDASGSGRETKTAREILDTMEEARQLGARTGCAWSGTRWTTRTRRCSWTPPGAWTAPSGRSPPPGTIMICPRIPWNGRPGCRGGSAGRIPAPGSVMDVRSRWRHGIDPDAWNRVHMGSEGQAECA